MRRSILATAVAALAVSTTSGDQLILEPDRDNTLYSYDGTLSNGAGQWIFAGQTRRAGSRRALLRFNLDALPAESQIVSASLELTCTRSITSDLDRKSVV